MSSVDTFSARSTLDVAGTSYEVYRLGAVPGLERLPFSLKVLAENLLRTEDGANITADHIRALAQWEPEARAGHRDPVHPRPRGDAGLHRRALRGGPGHHARGRRRPRRRPRARSTRSRRPSWSSTTRCRSTSSASATPSRATSSSSTAATRSATSSCAGARPRSTTSRSCRPGTGIVHQVNLEYLARVVMTREADGRRGRRLPRHLRRHRLAHHDGQRPRRAGLGRRRHRGRGRDARPAGLDAHPARGRLQAHRADPGGRHGHRRGAHHHRAAAQARRGRQVRGVLRRGRRRACRWPTAPRSAT